MGRRKANHRHKVYEENRKVSLLKKKIRKLSFVCKAREEKARRLKKKITEQQNGLNLAANPNASRKRKSTSILSISLRKKRARHRNPSSAILNNYSKLNLHQRRASERTSETIKYATVIHGGTDENIKPALDGLWCALVKHSDDKDLSNQIASTPKVMTKAVAPIIKNQVKQFEKSEANADRSLKVLYSGGLLSKFKYKQMRSNSALNSNPVDANKVCSKSAMDFMEGVPIPKILTYDKLQAFISTLDIGQLNDIQGLSNYILEDEDEEVIGIFRCLEDLLLKIAKLYLTIDAKFYSPEKPLLNWFGEERGSFKVALGADGAPFGKESEATAWLVSFLNVGTRVACPFDNFLLCGANCKEDHVAMVQFAKHITNQIKVIESKSYLIEGQQVSFSFELVPSDMKWLAFFSGELNNAAFYFSSFGNVNQSNMETLNGTLGPEPTDTWRPWEYNDRLLVAGEVEELKKKLESSKLTEKTKRNKVLNLIRDKESRQESKPIIGPLVDKALAEPLHNTNNAWQYFNNSLRNFALDISQIPETIVSVKELSDDCPFLLYLKAIKEAKCNLLYNKLKTWFLSRKTTFEFRFTGKESKAFCHSFMFLIAAVASKPIDSPAYHVKLHALAFLGLKLRDAVSLYSRQTVSPDYLRDLKSNCQAVFNTSKMFINHVTPTIWTIGYAIPYHASLTVDKLGLGLGINSMQGRESKHVHISKHAKHSLTTNRWNLVFKHEYITTLYLREKDACAYMYKHTNSSYIPDNANSDFICYCGYPKQRERDQCHFCSDPVRLAIERSVKMCKLDSCISQFFSSYE